MEGKNIVLNFDTCREKGRERERQRRRRRRSNALQCAVKHSG
jgi:hypothetical protein